MRRPPLLMVFLAVLVVALGASAGAAMGLLRAETERFARARVEVNRDAHGLSGTAEYDDEVIAQAVFTAEAGLSFFHTHGEGLGPLILVASTLVATLVPDRRVRGALYGLLGAGVLFPLGYLVYASAVLELGRDEGVALAEQLVLTPLGSAAILGLVGLLLALPRTARPSSE